MGPIGAFLLNWVPHRLVSESLVQHIDSFAVGDGRGYDRGLLLLMFARACVRRVRYFCLLYRMSGDSSAVGGGRGYDIGICCRGQPDRSITSITPARSIC